MYISMLLLHTLLIDFELEPLLSLYACLICLNAISIKKINDFSMHLERHSELAQVIDSQVESIAVADPEDYTREGEEDVDFYVLQCSMNQR